LNDPWGINHQDTKDTKVKPSLFVIFGLVVCIIRVRILSFELDLKLLFAKMTRPEGKGKEKPRPVWGFCHEIGMRAGDKAVRKERHGST